MMVSVVLIMILVLLYESTGIPWLIVDKASCVGGSDTS